MMYYQNSLTDVPPVAYAWEEFTVSMKNVAISLFKNEELGYGQLLGSRRKIALFLDLDIIISE